MSPTDIGSRVSPEVAEAVLRRDQGCMAPRLGAISECRDRFGRPMPRGHAWNHPGLTIDHVNCRMKKGKRAPGNLRHLLTYCAGHHLLGGWATTKQARMAARRHLERLYGPCTDCTP